MTPMPLQDDAYATALQEVTYATALQEVTYMQLHFRVKVSLDHQSINMAYTYIMTSFGSQ